MTPSIALTNSSQTIVSPNVETICGFKNVNDAVVRKLTSGDRQIIMNILEENNFGYNFEVPVDCPNCGHEFSGQLSAVNFL